MDSDPMKKRTCRRCGAPVEPQDRFCQHCGTAVASAEGHICRACGAGLGPAARFCARCGARVPRAWGAGFRAGWKRVRARAAAVDWTRVGRVAVPVAALLAAGLVGYALGQRAAGPPSSNHIVSATRGWRSETLPSSHPTRFRDFHVTASSWELANPPVLAADSDPYTAWHAWKTERFPEGDWLTLTFPTARVVTRIGLIPGRVGPRARADGRVQSLLVKAPGAPPQKLIFADRLQMQYRDLKKPLLTRTLILRIVTVLPGWRSRHIIIPEVQVWGYPAPSQVARRPE